ncbi:Nucleoside:H+ symporter:Major facilitator superfamily [hydrothermal vent metagenome]|uniref:Nucleoside:H+ symporter:Major facilitator superfamily n=1 Tax=hydrothermal vent metagenome TaxID=652676 RepID=A0A3B1B4R1_9ZZZZ
MPYWRLSGFYFFYFASLGALLPYWSLYLKSLGFNITEIGNLMAILMATKIISPNIWGWVADHTGRRMAIVRMGCLISMLAFAGVFYSDDFAWLVLVMVVFSFFWNATLPQFEATTFSHLGSQTHRYSSIRLWGSLGFIAAVWGLGSLLEGDSIRLLPVILLIMFAGIWLSSLLVPEKAAGHLSLDHEPLRKLLRRPEVLGLLVACFLMQASHGPYYTFYSIYLQDYGYSLPAIGGLWALGVAAEVGIFLLMSRLVPQFGLRGLLLGSLLLTALRWLITALYPESMGLMVFAQCLHAASFGIYHAVAIQYIHNFFSGRHQGKGQALYSSLSFGAGGALGSLYSGYLFDGLGARSMFLTAMVLALAGFFIAWRYLPVESSSIK